MAKAKIKDGKLSGSDYVKYDYGTQYYPRVERRWSYVPVEVCYHIERTNHPDFEVFYDAGEKPYSELKTTETVKEKTVTVEKKPNFMRKK